MKIHSAALALALLATACGRTSGFLRDANTVNEHQFKMEIVAQRYSRSVWGSSSISSVLCIVPIGDGAYRDAMAELQTRAKLQTNEVLENIREDHAFAAYIFVCTDTLIVSADVYQLFTTPQSVPTGGTVGTPSRSESPPEPNTPCERAFAQVTGDLPDVLRTLYPKARFIVAPSRQGFLSVCASQPDDVQICLQAPFLKTHADQCFVKFTEIAAAERTRLFGAFLQEW